MSDGIRKEPSTQGSFLIWSRRDLPGSPNQGPQYLAARAYDEFTADILVNALKAHAAKPLTTITTIRISPERAVKVGEIQRPFKKNFATDSCAPQGEWPNKGGKKAKVNGLKSPSKRADSAARGRAKHPLRKPPKNTKLPHGGVK